MDISPNVFDAIGTTFSVLFMLALFENVIVLNLYHSCEKLHIRTNMWIIAVIYCDMIIVLSAFPFVIISSFSKSFIFGYYGCQWDGFLVTSLGSTSIFLLTGLSLQRYFIMTSKLRSNKISRFRIWLAIGICLSFGLFWGIMPLIGWGSFELEGIGISCAPDWKSGSPSNISYTIAMYVFVFFIPVAIIIICYLSIVLKVMSFIISWTPYAVVSLLTSLFDMNLEDISPVIVQLPCLMAKTACIWNPVVYVCHNREFRKAFVEKFRLWNRASSTQSTYDLTSRPNTFRRTSST
ncbi:OPSD1-like protein, partial [Mya arenaria]